jgi:hypothetical protein
MVAKFGIIVSPPASPGGSRFHCVATIPDLGLLLSGMLGGSDPTATRPTWRMRTRSRQAPPKHTLSISLSSWHGRSQVSSRRSTREVDNHHRLPILATQPRSMARARQQTKYRSDAQEMASTATAAPTALDELVGAQMSPRIRISTPPAQRSDAEVRWLPGLSALAAAPKSDCHRPPRSAGTSPIPTAPRIAQAAHLR